MEMLLRIVRYACTVITLLIPVRMYSACFADDGHSFYYSFGNKNELVIVPDRFMLKKQSDVEKIKIESLVRSCFEDVEFEWFNQDICTVRIENDIVNEAIDILRLTDEIVSVQNVYMLFEDISYCEYNKIRQTPLMFGMTDLISFKYKDSISQSERDSIEKLFNMDLCSINKSSMFRVSKNSNILDESNRLYETGLFEYAHPELVCRVTYCDDISVYPNDPYFQYQVALHNIGQSFNGHTGTLDADIDAPEAWVLTMGSEDIVVAVIDQGVTSDHPDLPNSRQIRLNGSNFGMGDVNDPSPTANNNHGNACAGVIAATANNEEGIAGIAPLCKIMPIRTDDSTTPVGMAEAIRFAVNNGANVISNSWIYDTQCTSFSSEIIDAINYAINNGVIVLFAAGNNASHVNMNDGYVGFPGNNSIEGMLTVGASDRNDMQADYSPTDNNIDIVAPSNKAYPFNSYTFSGISGENLDMWTLDIPGINGYNPWPSDQTNYINVGTVNPNNGPNYLSYTAHFGGTSHACPVVAGVVALVLSVNPGLTPQMTCHVIKQTADKVGGYTYDSNGRCNQMGYGRVNANNAVWMACDTTQITGEFFYNSVSDIVGCDISMQDDTISNSIVRTMARNRVVIEKNVWIDESTVFKITNYR